MPNRWISISLERVAVYYGRLGAFSLQYTFGDSRLIVVVVLNVNVGIVEVKNGGEMVTVNLVLL